MNFNHEKRGILRRAVSGRGGAGGAPPLAGEREVAVK